VNKGLKTGTRVLTDVTSNSPTFTPITNRVTADEINDKTLDQAQEVALRGVTANPH
jgi:hypothetical protein